MNEDKSSFELNMFPVISLMGALISFLLLIAVWINVGTIDVQQGLGNETTNDQPNPPSVFAKMEADGSLRLMLKDVENAPTSDREIVITAQANKSQWSHLEQSMTHLKTNYPDMKTALVLPSSASQYEDMIKVMDLFRKTGFSDIGIAPL